MEIIPKEQNKEIFSKRGVFGRIKYMWKKRQLVKYLNDEYREKFVSLAPHHNDLRYSDYVSKGTFLEYVCSENTRVYKMRDISTKNPEEASKKRKKIRGLLDDCLDDKYIKAIPEDAKTIFHIGNKQNLIGVTSDGREFIKKAKFINEVIKEYGEVKSVIIAVVLSAPFGALIYWLLSII